MTTGAPEDGPERTRAEWQRRHKKWRRVQDLGLVLLAVGVLVLVFIALTYRPD